MNGPIGRLRRFEADLTQAQAQLQDFADAVEEIHADPFVGSASPKITEILDFVLSASAQIAQAITKFHDFANPLMGDGQHDTVGTITDQTVRS
jgi:hypothetical protein